jgi:hypothetical protein
MVAKSISIFAAFVVTLCCYGEVHAAKSEALQKAEAAARLALSALDGTPVDDPSFRNVGAIGGNARPRYFQRRTRVTVEMLRQLPGYAFAMLFTAKNMHCQIYCAFWVYDPWLNQWLIDVRYYGWGIASLFVTGGGQNDGARGYLRNLLLLDTVGAAFSNDYLTDLPKQALAEFLKVNVDDLPEGLRRIPHYGELLKLTFVGLNGWIPLLIIVVCCHNRCKSECRRRELGDREIDGICRGFIYCALPMIQATYFLELDPTAALGHAAGAVLPFMHARFGVRGL